MAMAMALVGRRGYAWTCASLASARGLSSKRRPRAEEDAKDAARDQRLAASLQVKQRAQFAKLRAALDEQKRERHRSSHAPARPPCAQDRLAREQRRVAVVRAKHHERIKHLPLFRTDSPLWRVHGASALSRFEHLPPLVFEGNTQVIASAEEEQAHAEYLQGQQVIGIDTESTPSFHHRNRENPVCLIQIATLERAFLYRVRHDRPIPPILRALLEGPSVLKIGHSLVDDVRLLQSSAMISSLNFTLDTLPVAKRLGCLRPALRTLGQVFLHSSINKDMQVSDWEAAELTPLQIQYAATDAWMPLRVMLAMTAFCSIANLVHVKDYPACPGAKPDPSQIDVALLLLEQCSLQAAPSST